MSNCPHCNQTTFEIEEVEASGRKIKLVQCTGCKAPLGIMEHTDVLFAIQWPRGRRHLLPEGFCIHLESSAEFGANWHGRKTPPFRVKHAPDRGRKPVAYC